MTFKHLSRVFRCVTCWQPYMRLLFLSRFVVDYKDRDRDRESLASELVEIDNWQFTSSAKTFKIEIVDMHPRYLALNPTRDIAFACSPMALKAIPQLVFYSEQRVNTSIHIFCTDACLFSGYGCYCDWIQDAMNLAPFAESLILTAPDGLRYDKGLGNTPKVFRNTRASIQHSAYTTS